MLHAHNLLPFLLLFPFSSIMELLVHGLYFTYATKFSNVLGVSIIPCHLGSLHDFRGHMLSSVTW